MTGATPTRPATVKTALGVMVAVLVVDLARLLAYPPASLPAGPLPSKVSFAIAVGFILLLGAGLVIAIALRQRWAFIVYTISAVVGLPSAILHLSRGTSHSAGSLAYLVLLVAGFAPIGLLLTPSARAWFARSTSSVQPSPHWYRDPTGRHEVRYWDGAQWTAHVSDHGQQSLDPLPTEPA